MPETGRCAVCDRHLELTMKMHEGGRRPRIHYQHGGQRCPGCDMPALPRTKKRKLRGGQDNLGAVYQAILDYIKAQRIPPTVREISVSTGLSSSAVYYNLQRLETANLIELRKGISRGIIVKGVVTA